MLSRLIELCHHIYIIFACSFFSSKKVTRTFIRSLIKFRVDCEPAPGTGARLVIQQNSGSQRKMPSCIAYSGAQAGFSTGKETNNVEIFYLPNTNIYSKRESIYNLLAQPDLTPVIRNQKRERS